MRRLDVAFILTAAFVVGSCSATNPAVVTNQHASEGATFDSPGGGVYLAVDQDTPTQPHVACPYAPNGMLAPNQPTTIRLSQSTCNVVGALAQGSPAPPPSAAAAAGPAREPAQIRLPGDWADIAVLERRYKFEALSFKARDETGVDWGSDEVMIKTTDAEGWTVAEVVEDIDSGDIHQFDPAKSCIVAVRPGEAVLDRTSVCDDVGRPAPLNFDVEMWESDERFFEFDFGCVYSQDHFGSYCVPEDGDDDFIGDARLGFSAQDLEAALPNVGDEFVETVVLNPCGSNDVCGGVPDYTFTYRITRMPNREIDMRAIVSATMQRTGARSEFEAIFAGLTALQAPQKRPIEPKDARAPSAGE